MSTINKKIAEMKSLYCYDKPVYSNIRFVEEVCIWLSKWWYKLTTGLYLNFKYFVQRQTRGFDDLDKWNAGWFIARKAVAVLTEWRKKPTWGTSIKKHTVDRFGNIIELKPDEYILDDSNHPEAFTEKEWNEILDDIIFAFQFIIDDDLFVMDVNSAKYKNNFKRHKNGLKLFSIYLTSLWD